MTEDNVTASCEHCGSKDFKFPNDPPKVDDIVTCIGCGREVGAYGDIQNALIAAGKTEIEKLTMKHLGVKPTWKSG